MTWQQIDSLSGTAQKTIDFSKYDEVYLATTCAGNTKLIYTAKIPVVTLGENKIQVCNGGYTAGTGAQCEWEISKNVLPVAGLLCWRYKLYRISNINICQINSRILYLPKIINYPCGAYIITPSSSRSSPSRGNTSGCRILAVRSRYITSIRPVSIIYADAIRKLFYSDAQNF